MRINSGIYIEEQCSYLTKNYRKSIYLGCPLNSMFQFDRLDYDEIVVVNKTNYLDSFDLLFLKKLTESSLKPKLYCGGIRNKEQVKLVTEIGFERIGLRSLFFSNQEEYTEILKFIGAQGVSLCLDIKKIDDQYCVVIDGDFQCKLDEMDLESELIPGEVLINNIDSNGTFSGVDEDLLMLLKNKKINSLINYNGGIHSEKDVNLLKTYSIDCATVFSAASSINKGRTKLLNNSIFKA